MTPKSFVVTARRYVRKHFPFYSLPSSDAESIHRTKSSNSCSASFIALNVFGMV